MPSPASERAFLDHQSTSHLSGKRRQIPFVGATVGDFTTPLTTATSPSLTADGGVAFTSGAATLFVPVTGLAAIGSFSFREFEVGAVAEILANPTSVGIDVLRRFNVFAREDAPLPPIFDSSFGTEFVGTGPVLVEGNVREVIPYFPDPTIELFTQPKYLVVSVSGAPGFSVLIHSLFIKLT
jgi:hypothetical protein